MTAEEGEYGGSMQKTWQAVARLGHILYFRCWSLILRYVNMILVLDPDECMHVCCGIYLEERTNEQTGVGSADRLIKSTCPY